MSMRLTDIHVSEGDALIKQGVPDDLFGKAKNFDVPFTYSGGATLGNFQSSVNVVQMGRLMTGGAYTHTVIITLHDIGLNHFTNYATLFQNEEMKPILENFTIFHIDFPCMKTPELKTLGGHLNTSHTSDKLDDKIDSNKWDRNLTYPSIEELAKAAIPAVTEFFKLSSVIMFSTGVGTNVGLRYVLAKPEMVIAFISLNPIFYQIGWPEWFNFKVSGLSNDQLVENLLGYLFTANELGDTSYDLVAGTRRAMMEMDPDALYGFYLSFKQRSPIMLERPCGVDEKDKKNPNVVQVPSCILIGDYASGFMEDAMELNSLLNPKSSNFCKLADAGAMVYEEQPVKVAEALRLFLQGLGYIATYQPTRLTRSRENSVSMVEEYNSRHSISSAGDADRNVCVSDTTNLVDI